CHRRPRRGRRAPAAARGPSPSRKAHRRGVERSPGDGDRRRRTPPASRLPHGPARADLPQAALSDVPQGPRNPALDRLDAFVGEWSMEAVFPGAPRTDATARTVFEWLPGDRFLVQRWEVDHPAAPDGIAIIGFDEGRDLFLQHYFDSRGVARIYEMTVEDGAWTL